MNDTDPITQAVEQLIAFIPATDFEDKPVLLALLNWFRSQEIDRAQMCSAMAALLGMFIGAIADDQADLKKGLAIYAKQIRVWLIWSRMVADRKTSGLVGGLLQKGFSSLWRE